MQGLKDAGYARIPGNGISITHLAETLLRQGKQASAVISQILVDQGVQNFKMLNRRAAFEFNKLKIRKQGSSEYVVILISGHNYLHARNI